MKILQAQGLGKTYQRGGQMVEAVRQVDLAIAPGEILAFLGPNGAGKTTTIKMIAGLIRPDRGTVAIADQNPHRDPNALRQLGAVLEGNRNLYWRLTPLENLEYFGVLRGLSRTEARRSGRELLERFGLSHKRDTAVQNLSRGMQQKVAIAVALVHHPKLLLLDEPTLGLDVEATQTVKALVREIAASGCAILLTTHQLDIAEELSDRVAIIRAGEVIAEQPTQELVRQFAGASYQIELEGNLADLLEEEVRSRLEAQGIVMQENRLFVRGAEALYEVLQLVRPAPIFQVKKDAADLTEVFLKLVQEQ